MITLHTQNTKAIVCFFQERPNHQATLQPPVLHQGEQIAQDACIYHTKNQTKNRCFTIPSFTLFRGAFHVPFFFQAMIYSKYIYKEWCFFYSKGRNRCRPSPLTRRGPSGLTSHSFFRLKHLARYSPCWAAT